MRKIGIITINGDGNYGNRLQNYAVFELLRKYGNPINLKKYDNYDERAYIDIIVRRHIKALLMFGKQLIKREYGYSRYVNFLKFNKNIKSRPGYLCKSTKYNKLSETYDVFVAGSDQIWNPTLYRNMYVNMLGFVKSKNKIAISPSISMDSLSVEQENMFRELLTDFDNLSCREEQGAMLLRKVTGKEVVSLVDPTLMLSGEEWDKLSKKPKFHDEDKKYILLYFLGELTNEYKSIIKELSDIYNLEVINLLDKKSRYYSCGPSEFIYLIKNCSLMLTDSFHGSVFSYIYNKPFRIFYRQGECGYMNSRLINLMNKLHLDDSIYLKGNDNLDNIMEVVYDKGYLKKEQEKFLTYMERCFKECEVGVND